MSICRLCRSLQPILMKYVHILAIFGRPVLSPLFNLGFTIMSLENILSYGESNVMVKQLMLRIVRFGIP